MLYTTNATIQYTAYLSDRLRTLCELRRAKPYMLWWWMCEALWVVWQVKEKT